MLQYKPQYFLSCILRKITLLSEARLSDFLSELFQQKTVNCSSEFLCAIVASVSFTSFVPLIQLQNCRITLQSLVWLSISFILFLSRGNKCQPTQTLAHFLQKNRFFVTSKSQCKPGCPKMSTHPDFSSFFTKKIRWNN